jgi:hypothetical protein
VGVAEIVLTVGGVITLGAGAWIAVSFFMPRRALTRDDFFEADDGWEWSLVVAVAAGCAGLAIAAIGVLLVVVT